MDHSFVESCDGAFPFVYLQLIALAIRFVLDSFLPVLCLLTSLFSFQLSLLSLFCNGMVESSERVSAEQHDKSHMRGLQLNLFSFFPCAHRFASTILSLTFQLYRVVSGLFGVKIIEASTRLGLVLHFLSSP